jgi:8-oxo-dGTP diphosphatase
MGGTNDTTPQVRAAGGIVLRAGKKEPKVLLIHRQRYDDWSFPKGKLENGESFKKAALREVLEETGMVCRTHRPRLPELNYLDGQGRTKEVRYWLMTVRKGDFVPNDEVDLISWVRVSKVVDRLTYRRDKELFASLVDSGRINKVI